VKKSFGNEFKFNTGIQLYLLPNPEDCLHEKPKQIVRGYHEKTCDSWSNARHTGPLRPGSGKKKPLYLTYCRHILYLIVIKIFSFTNRRNCFSILEEKLLRIWKMIYKNDYKLRKSGNL